MWEKVEVAAEKSLTTRIYYVLLCIIIIVGVIIFLLAGRHIYS